MNSEEFFEYIESRGKGNPDLEDKFLNLLRAVIGSSNNLDRGSMSIDEKQKGLNKIPDENYKIFLN